MRRRDSTLCSWSYSSSAAPQLRWLISFSTPSRRWFRLFLCSSPASWYWEKSPDLCNDTQTEVTTENWDGAPVLSSVTSVIPREVCDKGCAFSCSAPSCLWESRVWSPGTRGWTPLSLCLWNRDFHKSHPEKTDGTLPLEGQTSAKLAPIYHSLSSPEKPDRAHVSVPHLVPVLHQN